MEVKTRWRGAQSAALQAIDHQKKQRILRTIHHFSRTQYRYASLEKRCDVFVLVLSRLHYTWITDAFGER